MEIYGDVDLFSFFLFRIKRHNNIKYVKIFELSLLKCFDYTYFRLYHSILYIQNKNITLLLLCFPKQETINYHYPSNIQH